MHRGLKKDSSYFSLLIDNFKSFKSVGISCPWIVDKNFPGKSTRITSYEVDFCITAGSLISLEAYSNVGGFNENFFIDYVDFEYCLKLKRNFFKIIKNPKAQLLHTVGELKKWNIGPVSFYSTNHSPLRLYYRTRNRFQLREIYKSDNKRFFKEDLINFFKEIGTIILAETDKIQKMKMILRGYMDFKKSRFGKFQEQI